MGRMPRWSAAGLAGRSREMTSRRGERPQRHSEERQSLYLHRCRNVAERDDWASLSRAIGRPENYVNVTLPRIMTNSREVERTTRGKPALCGVL